MFPTHQVWWLCCKCVSWGWHPMASWCLHLTSCDFCNDLSCKKKIFDVEWEPQFPVGARRSLECGFMASPATGKFTVPVWTPSCWAGLGPVRFGHPQDMRATVAPFRISYHAACSHGLLELQDNGWLLFSYSGLCVLLYCELVLWEGLQVRSSWILQDPMSKV